MLKIIIITSNEFFTYFNYDDFKNNPNKYFHNESFIGITLFDTFNDFSTLLEF